MEIIMFIIFIVTNLLSYYVCNLRTHTPINMKWHVSQCTYSIISQRRCRSHRNRHHRKTQNETLSDCQCDYLHCDMLYCFINIAVFVLVYIVWMFAYIFGIIHIPNNSHRKMYALKIQNGWIIETQRKRFISTPAFQQKPVPRQSAINGTHSFNY